MMIKAGDKVKERVSALLRKVPFIADDDRMLLLTYWQVYDGIDIPPEVTRSICAKASKPESITRYKRLYKKSALKSSEFASMGVKA